MRTIIIFLASVLVVLLILSIGSIIFVSKKAVKNSQGSDNKQSDVQKTKHMQITSSAFSQNGPIPSRYACDGKNINPSLLFSGIPENTKSLALIVDDPDAPSKTWVHWILYNIPPSVMTIDEGISPLGSAEGMTDFGKPGYQGPCPPSGTHRYFFKLYALDSKLNLDGSAGKADIEQAMTGHILQKAELMGLYKRS